MGIMEKTVKELERLRSAKNIRILSLKMSKDASDIFFNSTENYDMQKNKKYVTQFSGIDTFIDPYLSDVVVRVYYQTPVSSFNSIVLNGDN